MSNACQVTRHHVADVLRLHIGKEHGISARMLAEHLVVNERRLRSLISELREEGTAVCGTPETGYYIASNQDELEQCCAFLRSRAMHSLTIESRLRRIPLPDLLGQLKLPS